MQIDLFGKKRMKVNLHMHTQNSDGALTFEDALDFYRDHGFDAVAVTDHWVTQLGGEHRGMTVLSGAEYNTTFRDSLRGVFHIVGVGMTSEPQGIEPDDEPQVIVDAIHRAGGIAILAHTAWSLNTPDQILPVEGFDATEIYNSVSGVHFSRRADSSLIVDMLGARGRFYPLVAADDAHYYDNDAAVSWIMVEADDNSAETLMQAIRDGKYYATQGPEVHLTKEGDEFVVRCSPCSEIRYFSNSVFSRRIFEGEGLTEARYIPTFEERYLRVEVVDREGRSAWSRILIVDEDAKRVEK